MIASESHSSLSLSLHTKCVHFKNPLSGFLNKLVEEIFHALLATAAYLWLWVFECIFLKVFEGDFAGFDLRADVFVEGAVARLDKVSHAAVLADRGCNLEAAGKGVHTADVCMHEVDWLVGLAAALGVEVEATGGEAAHFQDAEHDLSGQIDVGWELVGVPADQLVAAVGVDTAEHACIHADGELVLHRVTCECRVVGLDVELEVIHEAIFAQEV